MVSERGVPQAAVLGDAVAGQDQTPSRRDVQLRVTSSGFSPERIEVVRDELVRVTIQGDAVTHSFNVDEYRIAKRIQAEGSTVVEFRADREGTFPFYCNLTSEPGHDQKRGQLVVRSK